MIDVDTTYCWSVNLGLLDKNAACIPQLNLFNILAVTTQHIPHFLLGYITYCSFV